jgi:hypothetical protein
VELVDRYLKAVKDSLPPENRDDIIEELGSNIAAQMDERAVELGRPLTDAEQRAVLGQFGHPVVMAGKYRPDGGSVVFGRQLIGPALFPFYVRVLILNAMLAVLVVAAVAVFERAAFPGALAAFVVQALVQFAIVTLIFAMIQVNVRKSPESWDPTRPHTAQRQAGPRRVPRFESVTGLAVLVIVNLWFLSLLRTPSSSVGFDNGDYVFAPVWQQMFIPYLLLVLLESTRHIVNFIRPEWMRFRWAAGVASYALGVIIFGTLLFAGDSVIFTGAHPSSHDLQKLHWVNVVFMWSLIAAVVLNLVLGARKARRLLSAGRDTGG